MSGKYRGKSLSHITFKIPWIMSVWKLLSTYPLIQCQHTWLEYKAYIYIISTHKCVISQCEEHPPVQYTHQTQHSFYLWIPLLLQNVQILITPVISCAFINCADCVSSDMPKKMWFKPSSGSSMSLSTPYTHRHTPPPPETRVHAHTLPHSLIILSYFSFQWKALCWSWYKGKLVSQCCH